MDEKTPANSRQINYVRGDATRAARDGAEILVHVCNDIGGWGRGFVVALSERWRAPEERYRAWHRGRQPAEDETRTGPFALGEVQLVAVEDEGLPLLVGNMIGQHDVRTVRGVPPIRYEALGEALTKVAAEARRRGLGRVAMPKIGAGLAGGDWEKIATIVAETLIEAGLDVTVYLHE